MSDAEQITDQVPEEQPVVESQPVSEPQPPKMNENEKFCKHCGARIPKDAVLCTHCGRQVEQLEQAAGAQPSVVINNANTNTNTNTVMAGGMMGRMKNKWVAFLLCLFLGFLGAHKFYEGKAGMGVVYLFTGGLCGVGVLIDLFTLLFKPNPYYV